MREKLKSLRGQKYVGAVQLADEAARLIGQYVPRQERASVAELPDERMVRYYATEGLISPPEGRQGLSAVYGYGHLLQLLVVKRLQADHLPIRKIKELVGGKSERDLEQILNVEKVEGRREGTKNAATEYLELLLKTAAHRPPSDRPSGSFAPGGQVSASGPKSAWERVEIEPGLELHLREDYRLPDDSRDRQRLARRIVSEIETHGGRPRK